MFVHQTKSPDLQDFCVSWNFYWKLITDNTESLWRGHKAGTDKYESSVKESLTTAYGRAKFVLPFLILKQWGKWRFFHTIIFLSSFHPFYICLSCYSKQCRDSPGYDIVLDFVLLLRNAVKLIHVLCSEILWFSTLPYNRNSPLQEVSTSETFDIVIDSYN